MVNGKVNPGCGGVSLAAAYVHHHATPWLAGRRPGIGAGAACPDKPRRCAREGRRPRWKTRPAPAAVAR